MADNKHKILFVLVFLSCTSIILYFLSLITSNWINATVVYPKSSYESDVNYGVFYGNLFRQVHGAKYKVELLVVCDFSRSACIYSCQFDSVARNRELQRILNGEDVYPCLSLTTVNFVSLPKENNGTAKDPTKEYIPAELWLSTIVFLLTALVFSFTACAFSIINLKFHPVKPIFNIFGLYLWNGVSSATGLTSLIIWTVLFHNHLNENIAITDTLRVLQTFISADRASIGYSYYLLLIASLLHLTNIGLVMICITK